MMGVVFIALTGFFLIAVVYYHLGFKNGFEAGKKKYQSSSRRVIA